MTDRIISLQILRMVAATMVVYHHGTALAQSLCNSVGILGAAHFDGIGGDGIDLFFVVSGFIITRTGPLAQPRPTGAQFFWRRWGRVAPLFYLMTLPVMATYGLRSPVNVFGAGGPIAPAQIYATLFFWPSLGPVNVPPLLSNGWTLCFEMLFYTAVSMVMAGGKIRRNIIFAGVLVGVLLFMRHATTWNGFQILANAIFLEFGLGILLALVWRRLAGLHPAFGLGMIGLGTAGFVAWAFAPALGFPGFEGIMRDDGVIWRVLYVGAPAAMVVAGAITIDRYVRGPIAHLLSKLGDASYSIYLMHGLVILVLYFLWPLSGLPMLPSAMIVSVVLLSLAAGYLTFRYVEKPLSIAVRSSLPR
ncbi:MAG TPA: acyltransferase [Caulobacteraceae bacterium]|jgi:exopolysaccharide production protein ExoZ